jgi:hypothetical protein
MSVAVNERSIKQEIRSAVRTRGEKRPPAFELHPVVREVMVFQEFLLKCTGERVKSPFS